METNINYLHVHGNADPHIADLTNLPHADRTVIADLFYEAHEADDSTAREKLLSEFGHFAIEVADNDYAQRRADQAIAEAKTYGARIALRNAEKADMKSSVIDGGKIVWLSGEAQFSVDLTLVGEKENSYYIGYIVDKHQVTKAAFDHLADQGVLKSLLHTLENDGIPRLLHDVKGGSGHQRPVNRTGGNNNIKQKDRCVSTTYPAYKIDVQGTSNRSIVLLNEKQDELPVVIVAALYDHENQDKVLGVLSRKSSLHR